MASTFSRIIDKELGYARGVATTPHDDRDLCYFSAQIAPHACEKHVVTKPVDSQLWT